MKYLFASDIHGCAISAQKLIDKFLEEKADFLVLCGDILYHGPRNDLPEGYNPKKVIEILNSISDKIIAVKGNCDTEVDQMVLEFPILCNYTVIVDEGVRIFVTHGHIFNENNPLKNSIKSIVVSGHTHIFKAEELNDIVYLNPGSVSIPKEGNPKTYMIYDNKSFLIKDFLGNIIVKKDVR